MELTRRTALAGAAALTAAPMASTMPVHAAAPVADKQAASFYRYKVGEILVTVVSDGANTFPIPDGFVLNASKDDINGALDKAFRPRDKVTVPFAPLILNTGGKVVVIDTGFGEAAYDKSKGAIGQFKNNSMAAGIDPKSVDMVVISHFHADHIDGLLAADDKPAFPNAEILVPATEWKFFMDDGEMSRAPAGRMQAVFKDNRRVFDALNRKVTQYEWNKEILPGLLPIDTIGHTPGHTSFVLSSGNDKVFIQSDVTNNPDLFARNPGWHASYDQIPDQAETTRRKVYDMLVADKLKVQGFHYSFPGLGNIEKDGNGYRVVYAPWNPTI